MITHGSIFSGIGGFDLAAEWKGWKNVFQVEIDEFCNKVLKKRFPNTKRYGDIKKFDATKYRGTIDVLTGGFPCQPFSTAGNQEGANDNRFLWPENFRVIDELRPTHVVCENVTGIHNVEISTRIAKMEDQESVFVYFEKVIQRIIRDLESIGYEIPRTNQGEPILFNIPACAVQAQTRRDRVWIYGRISNSGEVRPKQSQVFSKRQQHSIRGTAFNQFNPLYRINSREYRRGESVFSGVVNGVPNWVDRIGALGNAINPYVAFELFSAIEATYMTDIKFDKPIN